MADDKLEPMTRREKKREAPKLRTTVDRCKCGKPVYAHVGYCAACGAIRG